MSEFEERLGAAIEHAAEFLPDGYFLGIGIERGGYSVVHDKKCRDMRYEATCNLLSLNLADS